MIRYRLFSCVLLLLVGSCASQRTPGPQKTQLEIRTMQTRLYDTSDMKKIMKAMLNVLQDDGFIVKQVDLDLGFFNATKEVDVENRRKSGWAKFWYGRNYAVYEKTSIIDCTANVSEYGDQMRVRANFQAKTLNNKGGVVSVHVIDDLTYYQDFFSKVDKGVFIEKEKL